MAVESTFGQVAMSLQVVSLLLVGIAVEKHYVSRVTGFTNGIAAVVHVLTIPSPNVFVAMYAAFGFLLGAVGFWFYYQNRETGDWYRVPAFFLFSSWNVAWIVAFPASAWGWAVLIGVAGQFVILKYADEDVTWFGPLGYPVVRGIKEYQREQRIQEGNRILREIGF